MALTASNKATHTQLEGRQNIHYRFLNSGWIARERVALSFISVSQTYQNDRITERRYCIQAVMLSNICVWRYSNIECKRKVAILTCIGSLNLKKCNLNTKKCCWKIYHARWAKIYSNMKKCTVHASNKTSIKICQNVQIR